MSWLKVSTGTRSLVAARAISVTASSVAKLVIRYRGTRPSAPAVAARTSAILTSRKVCPSTTSTAAFTAPPKRVAMPPARTTVPT